MSASSFPTTGSTRPPRGRDAAGLEEEMTRRGAASAAMLLARRTCLDLRGEITPLRYGLA